MKHTTPNLEIPSAPRPGVRLGQNNNQQVLLMPERALRLNGPSLEIVQRCDGKHTVAEIVTEFQQLYSKAEPAKVESDILGYLHCSKTSAPSISNRSSTAKPRRHMAPRTRPSRLHPQAGLN